MKTINYLDKLEGMKEFDLYLGGFVRGFAELEFYLLYMWGVIDYPQTPNRIYLEKAGSSLDERRKTVTKYIHGKLPQLMQRWDRINAEIGELNKKRRFLVHKTGQGDFYKDSARFYVPENGRVNAVEYTIQEVKSLHNDFAELFTGNDGINGIFAIEFTKERFNEYNKSVTEGRIVYKINGEIITDYKG